MPGFGFFMRPGEVFGGAKLDGNATGIADLGRRWTMVHG
jgi:hypothetical protein